MERKRGPRGEGSKLQLRKDGLWHGHVDFGTDPVTKKPDRRHISHKDFDEAESRYNAVLYEATRQKETRLPKIAKLTTGQWLQYWLEVVMAGVRNPRRWMYRDLINSTITPKLGHILLRDLSVDHLVELLEPMDHIDDRLDNLNALQWSLRDAVDRGLIACNPATQIHLRRADWQGGLEWFLENEAEVTRGIMEVHKP